MVKMSLWSFFNMVNLGHHQFQTPKIDIIWACFAKRTSEHGLLEDRFNSVCEYSNSEEHVREN